MIICETGSLTFDIRFISVVSLSYLRTEKAWMFESSIIKTSLRRSKKHNPTPHNESIGNYAVYNEEWLKQMIEKFKIKVMKHCNNKSALKTLKREVYTIIIKIKP